MRRSRVKELLLATPQVKVESDWSPNGRFLLYRSLDPKMGYDLWALPLTGDRKPFPVVQTNSDERDGQFSPDGKWIAYQFAVETIWVRHVSGGLSSVNLKSFEQGREAFQGTSIEVIWMDEEPDIAIVTECLLRTMDTPDMPCGGVLLLTLTPLRGMTPLILSFLQEQNAEARP